MQTAQSANDLMQHIIVGIDPGKTAALACLDLEGNAIYVDYGRFVGRDWFIDRIKKVGIPIIVASDKKNASELVSKISAAFNANLFSPKSDISVKRKKELQASHLELENLHERDALAAAIAAYNAYANKLKQAERIARERGISDTDKVKYMVIKKYSIEESISNKKSGRK